MGFDPKFLNYCEETNSSPIVGLSQAIILFNLYLKYLF